METDIIIEKAAKVLSSGGVMIYPTDTIWGLGCDATNPEAIEKLCGIKHRDPAKSMLILCADFDEVRQYVAQIPAAVEKYLLAHKRPTTVIYPQARNLPPSLVAADGSIGIRVPKSDFCQRLLNKFGKPIVSTSANFAGEEPPKDYYHLDAWLIEQVDFLVPPECCDSHCHKGSRIIKIGEDGELVVIR